MTGGGVTGEGVTGEGEGVQVLPVVNLPEFVPGMAVGEEIAARAELRGGDVVVVSQKVVSKAEGRIRKLSSVLPGAEARRLAAVLGKEPALVELILEESREVLRAEAGVLVVETRHGFVCANAGIDTSNLPDPDAVCLLPEDPDASARNIRQEITTALTGDSDMGVAGHSPLLSADSHVRVPPTIAVVISDSFGRAWRVGQAEVAIGCAGLAPLDDWRGRVDASGHTLEATLIAIADEAAAAADLVRDKASRVPAAVVRGISRFTTAADGPGAAALRRPPDQDLFR
jgi:coenzyme F420-0:L-glutamate ligase/coenzyme F420-1:gamma-L-glutamate ligase